MSESVFNETETQFGYAIQDLTENPNVFKL